MGILVDFGLLAVGLGLLLFGGEWLVRGAAGLARTLDVSSLIIGLTVVSFGTSAPELAVSTDAAIRGQTDLCFGNIIGSNIANIGLILAVGALMRPLDVVGTIVPREIPMMLLATVAVVIMACDSLTSRGGVEQDVFDRGDGLILLLLFCIFLYNATKDALRQRAEASGRVAGEAEELGKGSSVRFNLFLTVIGAGLLYGGAELTVKNAGYIAEQFGVPQVIIGLTVVAFGTSLPELVATVIATRRGESAIAIGNVVGSNIFNLLFVKGVTAVIADIRVPPGGFVDLIVMTVMSFVMLWFSVGRVRRIVRSEGLVLLVSYLAYIGFRVWTHFSN